MKRRTQYRTRGGHHLVGGPSHMTERSSLVVPNSEHQPIKLQHNTQNFNKTERKQPIQLQHEEKDIKLNDEQAAEIAKIDEKLKEIGEIDNYDNTVLQGKLDKYEREVNNLNSQIYSINQAIESLTREQEKYTKENTPNKAEFDNALIRMNQIDELLVPIKNQISEIKAQRTEYYRLKAELKENYSYLDVKQVDQLIDQIENEIETSTLTVRQIRQKQSQLDSLKLSREKFAHFYELERNMEIMESDNEQIFSKKRELGEEKTRLWELRKNYVIKMKENKIELEKFKKQKEELFLKTKDLKKEIKRVIDEKNEYRVNFYNEKSKSFDLKKKRSDLIYQKRLILFEADKRMIALSKPVGRVVQPPVIQRRVNPYENQISICKSLISYFQGIIEKEQEQEERKKEKVHEKKVSDMATDILLSVRNSRYTAKKEAKKAKQNRASTIEPEVQKLILSAGTIKDLSTVGVKAPTAKGDVQQTIDLLKQKIHDWTVQFVDVQLLFDIQNDGTIKCSIKL